MSDDAEEEETSEEKKSSGVIQMIATALLAGLFGAAGTLAVQHSPLGAAPEPAAEEEAADEEALAEMETPEEFQERVITFEPIVVNIAGSGSGRFLKVTVAVVTDSVETREELEVRMPQVKDSIITLMSSKRVVDVADFEGKVLLKEDLRSRIDAIIARGSVESVLLTEFVVQ